jgi:hypothetical protein
MSCAPVFTLTTSEQARESGTGREILRRKRNIILNTSKYFKLYLQLITEVGVPVSEVPNLLLGLAFQTIVPSTTISLLVFEVEIKHTNRGKNNYRNCGC